MEIKTIQDERSYEHKKPVFAMSLDQDGFLDSASASAAAGSSQPLPDAVDLETAEAHPIAQIFTVLFKALALLFYLFASSGFVFSFVLCVLFIAFDFWTVKNVSGRLLVGLRWWHEVQEDGSDRWIYESRSATRKVHALDSKVFWMSLYITPVVWLVLALSLVLKFTQWTWVPVVVMALALSSANCAGYYKCDRDAKKKIQSFIAQRL